MPFTTSPFLSLSLLLPLSFCKRRKIKTPSSYPVFTTLVNPSQLQSVMIRSLINATGKERSKLGKLKTSQYLGFDKVTLPSFCPAVLCLVHFCDSTVSCHPICKFRIMPPILNFKGLVHQKLPKKKTLSQLPHSVILTCGWFWFNLQSF